MQIHFRDYPAEHLMQCEGDEGVQMQFFMSLKACPLCQADL